MNISELQYEHVERMLYIYSRAIEQLQIEKLVLFSGDILYESFGDIPMTFSASPFFRHLVPEINLPGCWVVFEAGKTPKLIVRLEQSIWRNSIDLPEYDWLDMFDLKIERDTSNVLKYLTSTEGLVIIGELNDKANLPKTCVVNPENVIRRLHWMRSRKTKYEIACISHANYISAIGHEAAKRCFFSGGSEFDIHISFLTATKSIESSLSYPSVVALNRNCSVLHYDKYSTRLQNSNDSLLIDAGVSYLGYVSDISRTYSNNSYFEELIARVTKVKNDVIEAIPDVNNYLELWNRGTELLAKEMIEFGLFKSSIDEVIDNKLLDFFMPHSLGHFMGVLVHEPAGKYVNSAGDIQIRGGKGVMSRAIESNHVFTVEPGIYFIKPLLEQLSNSKFKNVVNYSVVEALYLCGGVRVEDNVVALTGDFENLTTRAFALKKEIENEY